MPVDHDTTDRPTPSPYEHDTTVEGDRLCPRCHRWVSGTHMCDTSRKEMMVTSRPDDPDQHADTEGRTRGELADALERGAGHDELPRWWRKTLREAARQLRRGEGVRISPDVAQLAADACEVYTDNLSDRQTQAFGGGNEERGDSLQIEIDRFRRAEQALRDALSTREPEPDAPEDGEDEGWWDCPHCQLVSNPDHLHYCSQCMKPRDALTDPQEPGDEPEHEHLTREQVMARFCRLQSKVADRVIGYSVPNDCFCENPDEGGLEPGHSARGRFRSSGAALRWIEEAVDQRLRTDRPSTEGLDRDEAVDVIRGHLPATEYWTEDTTWRDVAEDIADGLLTRLRRNP